MLVPSIFLSSARVWHWYRVYRCALSTLAVAVSLGLPAVSAADAIKGLLPLSPQPAADAVKPGLAVEYLYQKFYTLDEIYDADVQPEPGKPIPVLDQVTEQDASGEDKIVNVLTSDQSMMVGAFIRGIIHFEDVGNYVLYLVSNDGARFWVGGVMIWEDPEVHFDRESDSLELAIAEPGWYELKIDYYQKKGTSALQLLWTPPGGEKSVVPADVLGHLE